MYWTHEGWWQDRGILQEVRNYGIIPQTLPSVDQESETFWRSTKQRNRVFDWLAAQHSKIKLDRGLKSSLLLLEGEDIFANPLTTQSFFPWTRKSVGHKQIKHGAQDQDTHSQLVGWLAQTRSVTRKEIKSISIRLSPIIENAFSWLGSMNLKKNKRSQITRTFQSGRENNIAHLKWYTILYSHAEKGHTIPCKQQRSFAFNKSVCRRVHSRLDELNRTRSLGSNIMSSHQRGCHTLWAKCIQSPALHQAVFWHLCDDEKNRSWT